MLSMTDIVADSLIRVCALIWGSEYCVNPHWLCGFGSVRIGVLSKFSLNTHLDKLKLIYSQMLLLNRFLPRWLRPVPEAPEATVQASPPFSLEVEFLAAERVVKITTHGVLMVAANDQLVATAITAGKQHDTCLFLVDDRDVEVAMSYVNLYDLPEHNRKLGGTASFRVALLFAPLPSNSAIFKFYEDRTVITDFQQGVFTNEQSALDWLLQRQHCKNTTMTMNMSTLNRGH